MQRERLTWLRLGAAVVDLLALMGLWGLLVLVRREAAAWLPQLATNRVDLEAYLPVGVLVVATWVAVLVAQGSYRYLRRKSGWTVLSELTLAALTGLAAVAVVLFLLQVTWVSRLVLLGFAALSVPTLALMRGLGLRVLRGLRRGQRFDPYRVLIVGAPQGLAPLRQVLAQHPEWAIELVGRVGEPPPEGTPAPPQGRLPWLGEVSTLAEQLTARPIDEVLLSGLELGELEGIAGVCEELGVPLSMDANFLGLRTARVELQDFEGWAALRFTSVPSRGAELVLKRAMDVVGAATGLLLGAPLLLVAAALVKVQDPAAPVLFVQERAGRYGRPFRMLKLRTMRPDAEAVQHELSARNEMSGPVFKVRDDPRITPVGRLLRRWSVDELPQLWNVLKGEMSLVGPRPPLPAEVREYERWQLRRLSVRPGLTCTWQVSGRNEVDFDRWMQLDLEYIDNWSVGLDLRLIARTVPAVLRGTGAA